MSFDPTKIKENDLFLVACNKDFYPVFFVTGNQILFNGHYMEVWRPARLVSVQHHTGFELAFTDGAHSIHNCPDQTYAGSMGCVRNLIFSGFLRPDAVSVLDAVPKVYIDKATQVINFNKGQIVPQSVIDKAIDDGRCYVQRSLRCWPDGKDLCFEQTKSETQVEIKFYWKDQEPE